MKSIFLIIPLFFVACAPRVVYKEVKIPVKCDVKEREKPRNFGNSIFYLKEILIYTEGLERDLQYCRGVN